MLLYRTTPSISPRPKQEHQFLTRVGEDFTAKRKVVVLESDMDDEMADAVIDKTMRLYNYFIVAEDNESKIAEALKVNLEMRVLLSLLIIGYSTILIICNTAAFAYVRLWPDVASNSNFMSRVLLSAYRR